MTADTCKYPGCGADTGHRPYARKRDAPSASAIAEMLDDGKGRSFAWAASLIAATEAVHNPGAWSGLIDVPSDRALKNGRTSCDHTKDGLCKACTYLRSEFDRRWTAKATVGTHIHHLALSWSKGETVDVDEACDGYMDALQDFWEHRQPEWLHLESTVQGVRGGKVAWRGQFDWIARVECPVCPSADNGYSARCVWIGDWKGLALDTKIPTPSGWVSMRYLQVGDTVFGSDGRPCSVTAKSEVHWNPCYRIRFDDGSDVICDHEHRWLVEDQATKTRRVLTTAQIAADVESRLGRGTQRRLGIPNPLPLDLPEVPMPVDPYLIGAWLGDGTRGRSQISLSAEKQPIIEAFADAGFPVNSNGSGRDYNFSLRQFRPILRHFGLLGADKDPAIDKHIPRVMLRASIEQRLSLLQGLMDTDGTWNKTRHQAIYTTTSKQLALDVYELVMSLGWRASQHSHTSHGFGLAVTEHTVSFTYFDRNPFRLVAHKRDPAAEFVSGTPICRRRMIISVDSIPTVATQCITVDSPDSTYLCGEQMVVTHNTGGYYPASQTLQLALYRYATNITAWADGVETVARPMPPVVHAGVCLLSPDGYHRLVELPVDGEAFNTALRLLDIHRWQQRMRAWAKAHPLEERFILTDSEGEAA